MLKKYYPLRSCYIMGDLQEYIDKVCVMLWTHAEL